MLQKIILTENSNWENKLCLKHLKTVFIGIVYASSLYRTEKRSSSIAGKISSAKIFAQDFSRAFFSRSVSAIKLSSKDNC